MMGGRGFVLWVLVGWRGGGLRHDFRGTGGRPCVCVFVCRDRLDLSREKGAIANFISLFFYFVS